MNLGEHTWSCSFPGCKKFIMAYTDGGLRALRDAHLDDHDRKDREQMAKFQDALKLADKTTDYNKLKLTWQDVCFLRNRQVAIDENIEYDPTIVPRPTNSELVPGQWARVLDQCRRRDGNSRKPELPKV